MNYRKYCSEKKKKKQPYDCHFGDIQMQLIN